MVRCATGMIPAALRLESMGIFLFLVALFCWVLADLCRVQEGLRLPYAVASLFASLVAGPMACLAFVLLIGLFGSLLPRGADGALRDVEDLVLLGGGFLSLVFASAVFALTFQGLLKLAGKLFIRWQRITPAQYERFFCGRKNTGLEQDSQQDGR